LLDEPAWIEESRGMASETGGVGLVSPAYEFDDGWKESRMKVKDSNGTAQRDAA